MLVITSSRLMPIPLSLMVSVRAVALVSILISSFSSLPRISGLVSASKRRRSRASEALEISSRRKISLLEYSEWITISRSCLVSAWNSKVPVFGVSVIDVSVLVVMAPSSQRAEAAGLAWVGKLFRELAFPGVGGRFYSDSRRGQAGMKFAYPRLSIRYGICIEKHKRESGSRNVVRPADRPKALLQRALCNV